MQKHTVDLDHFPGLNGGARLEFYSGKYDPTCNLILTTASDCQNEVSIAITPELIALLQCEMEGVSNEVL